MIIIDKESGIIYIDDAISVKKINKIMHECFSEHDTADIKVVYYDNKEKDKQE